MLDFFGGWANRVMVGVSDEQLKVIFNATTAEDEDVVEWQQKINLYKECSDVLDDLSS